MKSIIWFKLKQQNPLLYFCKVCLLSLITLFIYLKMEIHFLHLVAVFPIVSIFFSFICSFSNNLFILSENIFSTPLTIHKIWNSTAIFATFVGTIISEIILLITWIIVGTNRIESPWIYILFNLIGIFISFVWILMSTVHYAGFTKGLKYLSSLFSLGYCIFPFTLHRVVNALDFTLMNLLLLAFTGISFYWLSNSIIDNCTNKEKLVINTGIDFVNELSELELD